jgi:hypothetical protein
VPGRQAVQAVQEAPLRPPAEGPLVALTGVRDWREWLNRIAGFSKSLVLQRWLMLSILAQSVNHLSLC